MATFTMVLRKLVEQYDIGLRDYPIFDSNYRNDLNKKIVDHFYFHEIGFETPEMFVHQLNERMRLIMPPMNEMYKTLRLEIDPLLSMSLRTVSQSLSDSEATSERTQGTQGAHSNTAQSDSDTDSTSRSVNSQFPQTMLAGNEDYATSANDSVSNTGAKSVATEDGAQSSSSELSGKETGTATGSSDTLLSGHTGSQADLVMRFRAAIVNVDQMVIDQLSDLFMTVLDTQDQHSPMPLYRRGSMPLLYGYGFGGF